MVSTSDLKEAIRDGCSTSGEIAAHADVDETTARRYLKQAAEDDDTRITRERAGNGYVYGLVQDSDSSHDAEMRVLGDRDYDWTNWVPPHSETGYVELDGEKSDIDAILSARHETGQKPRFRLTGPPGTGKTTLARAIAAERQWPMFSIQFTASMRDSELLGSPHLIGGDSVWVDGPLTKAVLCSQTRPCVVVLDEVNRAPFHRKSSLQSFLDDRCQVVLTLLGGEVIEGEPLDVATVATMNEGDEYEAFDIDPAEKRRHSNTWEVQFLGLVDVDREASLIADRTPISHQLARAFVEAANDVRELALEDATSPIGKGIATSTLLEWARTTRAFGDADRPQAIRRAARSAIVRPHYDGAAAGAVEAILVDEVKAAAHRGATA